MRITSGEILEFEDLRRLLGRFVASPLGAAELERLRPLADRAALEEMGAETAEAIEHGRALEKPQPAGQEAAIRVRFDGIPDCREAIVKLRIEGMVLDAGEILSTAALMESATELRSALLFSAERFPRLAARAERLGDFRLLARELAGKILPDGTLSDQASVALGRLRREIERQKQRIQESLERFVRVHRGESLLQEEFVTIRNDRFVVPIIAGQHRRVEGVIHGASGTGHTLFVEPLETIGLNNELVHLVEEEAREEHRILREMTERLREARVALEETAEETGRLDLLFAKARFALAFDGTVARFSPPGARRLLLREARHPLLEDVLRRQGKPIVPVSLSLSGEERTLLISGPNTGGKTVALKTVGLLALMAQAGVPAPCAEAEFPVFAEVLADIGDNQSIQESLSTFSAHITRIREMLEEVTADSLVLLDELGRATDPAEGGALGVTVLEAFRASGAFALATTHLLALKVYGANTGGVVNGSMGFDEETLEPTYRLRLGAPGKSAGLEIAARLGLPGPLIERARAVMSTGERDVAAFVNQLHQRLEEVSRLEAELAGRLRRIEERERSLAKEWARRESVKLAELERRMDRSVEQFEARARAVITELERAREEKKAVAEARRKVARTAREFREEFEASVLGKPVEAAEARVSEGVMVRLRGVRQPARVRRMLGDGRIEVEAGYLKLQVASDDVLEVLPPEAAAATRPKTFEFEAGPRWNVISREINVIGRRAEEACGEVDKFLDNAVLASVDRVRIVHGHGMGILKRAIAELLANNPHVERFYPASQIEGGTGATIAELKGE
jgi:DNA mismatch repair protein MutS2